MKTAPIPKNEMQRIQQLLSYEILDTTPEDEYNYITTLASFITKAPICLISLIDTNRQWFKSCYGIDNLKETDRSVSFCSHAINQSDIFIIENALLDERFKNNPLVSGEAHVRFYAGVPLIDSAGMALGTLCVINTEPGVLSADQIIQLKMLASQVIKLMELRKANLQIQKDYSEMSILSSKYINQQKQLEEALDNAAKLSAIGEIAASIAHEIRNPLHIVGMESELLASLSESKQSPLEESVFSSITNIDQALDRINGIIKGLTINSRLVKDEFQNVEIKSVIDDCLSMILGKAKKNQIKLNINCSSDLKVLGRASDLGQVLINLINNSIDAVSSLKQKDKWININTEKVGETVRISVTDCGMGIPSQVVESMFNSFYTTKESGKGTGLGLSISTKIIKNHGGNLYYDETSENTRFVIDFDKAAF